MTDTLDVLPKVGHVETPVEEKRDDIFTSEEKGQHIQSAEALEPEADEVLDNLKQLKKEHKFDPNLPDDVYEEIDEAFHADSKTRKEIANDLLDNSPYPEVRAAVPNYDEGGLANTLRAWVIGMTLATVFSAINALLSMRQPYIAISSYVAQVLSYPIGYAWARYMPEGRFSLLGKEYRLNPGPFNKKEHTIIVLMANATFGGGAAYATDIVLAQRAFYKQRFGWPFEIFLCISNNMLGFGLAGLFNRFLVQPAAMLWPSNFVNTTLFTALHDSPLPDPAKTSGWKMGKYRLFCLAAIGSFVWYFIPGYIFPALSAFAFATFAAPQNVVVNQLFGAWSGLSLLPITFDWSQISGFNFSPLIAPWHAIANTLIGMVTFYWFTTIGVHYSGAFYSKYLPISDSNSYDNTGNTYNVSRIINKQTQTFDLKAYQEYSPLFLSTTFMLSYGLSFASIAAVLVHTALFHGKDIWHRFRNFNVLEEDVHARMMGKYKQVPLWWYLATLAGMIAIGLGICVGYPTHLPWWAFLFSILIGAFFFLPIGIVQAVTNIGIGLNVFTEFVVGYMLPGRPMAMMLFKAYGYMALFQGIFFCGDMKLGTYMKVSRECRCRGAAPVHRCAIQVPPRVTFACQMIACAWCSVVQIAVINWALGSIEDVCHQDQKNHFSCPNGKVFFNASIIWGAIGPKRIFSSGQLYSPMLYFFIPGLILPAAIYFGARMFPKSPIKYLSAPIIFGGAGLIPPATPLNYISWGVVGYIFNKVIRNRHRGWWSFYNYILSAGLDVGLAFSTILIFSALEMTNTSFPAWWGNTGALNTLDYNYAAVQATVGQGETFGPTKW